MDKKSCAYLSLVELEICSTCSESEHIIRRKVAGWFVAEALELHGEVTGSGAEATISRMANTGRSTGIMAQEQLEKKVDTGANYTTVEAETTDSMEEWDSVFMLRLMRVELIMGVSSWSSSTSKTIKPLKHKRRSPHTAKTVTKNTPESILQQKGSKLWKKPEWKDFQWACTVHRWFTRALCQTPCFLVDNSCLMQTSSLQGMKTF